MLTVKIISGTYGYKIKGRIVPKDHTDEPFSLDDSEAKRLVSLGVAEIITESVATGENGKATNPPSVNPSNDEGGSSDENEGENDIDGHLDAEQLKEMTIKELKALAEDMGIDTSKMKVKNDYVQAIVSIEVSVPSNDEGGENPPDISPEAPVV